MIDTQKLSVGDWLKMPRSEKPMKFTSGHPKPEVAEILTVTKGQFLMDGKSLFRLLSVWG